VNPEKRITKFFNLMLFVYLLANLQLEIWLAPETKEALLWDQMFQDLPSYFSLIAFFLFGIFLILWGSWLIKIFWNTFMRGIFKIREITSDEAIALALIFTLVSG